MPDEAFINVEELIAGYDIAGHARMADAYYDRIEHADILLRKPFFGISVTQQTLYGLSAVLEGLKLYPGAVVLDFGAGIGWLAKSIAMLGCSTIAMDVSARALEIGEQALRRDPVAKDLDVRFIAFDGFTIPLADGSVDRIVCFDAFHHVANQRDILSEFRRVLRPGGIAAFHEPGPEHSRHPQSQYEMRHHGVIENDIHIERIWGLAQGVGFTDIRLALTMPRPVLVGLSAFQGVAAGRLTPQETHEIQQQVTQYAASLRIFFLMFGEEAYDTRFPDGIGGTFSVEIVSVADGQVHGIVRARNTGMRAWRPSGEPMGGVKLGVRIARGTGTAPLDHARAALCTEVVAPGESVEQDFCVPLPPGEVELLFDLVAERVTWFEVTGTPIVRHSFRS